jgi:hypothetical protein
VELLQQAGKTQYFLLLLQLVAATEVILISRFLRQLAVLVVQVQEFIVELLEQFLERPEQSGKVIQVEVEPVMAVQIMRVAVAEAQVELAAAHLQDQLEVQVEPVLQVALQAHR